ncbi:MAG: hypothetical protein R3B96_23765 [Pirellulaceae bacterium]
MALSSHAPDWADPQSVLNGHSPAHKCAPVRLGRWRVSVLTSIWSCVLLLPTLGLGAELIRLTDENYDQLVPAGKEVDAIVGDFVLRNEHLVVVVAQPEPWRHANLTIRNVGGAILDFSTRDGSNDQLGLYSPLGGRYAFRQMPDGITADYRREGSPAVLELESAPASDGTVCRLIYSLGDGDTSLTITTLVSNPTDSAVEVPVRDSMRADRTFTDGIDASGETAAEALFWVEDRWFPQAYGVVAAGWTPVKVSGRGPIIDWTREGRATETVAPGATFEMQRRFYAASHRLGLRGVASAHETEPVHLLVKDSWGPISDALVTFSRGETVHASAATDNEGRIQAQVPAGEYNLKITSQGRPSRELTLTVEDAIDTTVELEPSARIKATVVDDSGAPIPFKLELVGRDGTDSPDFGPDSRAWASGNVVYSASGETVVDVMPGTYELVFSHGIEHDAVIKPITVVAGEVGETSATLKHVVDTTGWVSTEYHSHSTPSGDNTSDQLGRVLNLLAENLEFALARSTRGSIPMSPTLFVSMPSIVWRPVRAWS